MASTAQKGNSHLVGRRVGVLGRENLMRPVAIGTIGGVGSFPEEGLPMDGSREVDQGVIVTGAALDLLQVGRMGKVFGVDIGVALDALQMLVDRSLEGRLVHVERVAARFPFGANAWIGMAVEAGVIVRRVRRSNRAGRDQKRRECAKPDPPPPTAYVSRDRPLPLPGRRGPADARGPVYGDEAGGKSEN
jgi:hypothetical protein